MLLITYIWTEELKHPNRVKILQSIGYGLVLGLIHIETTQLFHQNVFFGQNSYTVQYFSSLLYLTSILEGLLVLGLVLFILKSHQAVHRHRLNYLAILGMILLTILSFKITGLMTGLLIIILGFHHSNHILRSLGFIALALNISAYYYLLSDTLLEKSLSLLLLGLGLLIGRWIIFHLLWTKKESSHA
jgi:uncharacterized membrane protein